MRIRSLSWFIKQCWFETNKCKSSQEEALIDAWLALELQRLSSCTLFSGRLWFVYWAIRRFTDNLFSLGHAWLSLWSENMITGRINQFARFKEENTWVFFCFGLSFALHFSFPREWDAKLSFLVIFLCVSALAWNQIKCNLPCYFVRVVICGTGGPWSRYTRE